jgi:hypothetical protein
MNKHYQAELQISFEHRTACIRLFDQCREFDSPAKLRSFASVKDLELVRQCVPTAESLDRNDLINALLERRRSPLEPALLVLLDALARFYEEDVKGNSFKELRNEISNALIAGPDQDKEETDYQSLVAYSAPDVSDDIEPLAHKWIDETINDLEEFCLRITLAVLNGTSFREIERANRDLFESLQALVTKSSAANAVPSKAPMMKRLMIAGAKETTGKPPEWRRVVELDKPELAIEAFNYAWEVNHETEWRKRMMSWLTGLAANRPADVRTRAAVATGRLALKDYRFIRDQLLMDWVRKDDAQYRTATGMALGVMIRDESFLTEVPDLLYRWAHSEDPRERWAAMRAYIYVGPYFRPPDTVIAGWREIAASERIAVSVEIEGTTYVLNNPLHMSLMDAIVKFFVLAAQLPGDESRVCFEGVLEALKLWISTKTDDTRLATFMFFTLGHLMLPTREGQTGNPPVLLQLIEDQESRSNYRTQLAKLFELAMRNGTTIVEARDILCRWFRWTDSLQDQREVYESRLRTFLQDIVAVDEKGKTRGKLIASLHSCGRNRTAERVLVSL